MTEYLDRYPTMHEYAEGKRINPKLTDLISRADAIEAVASITMSIHLSDVICDKLSALPSADAVQGEWIEVEVFPEVYDIEGVKTWGSEMQCDQCGFRHTAIEGHMAQYNFCPNCGARMKGGAE